VTAIFLLEATSAKVASVALIPGLAASGVGFLVYTGVGSVTGFEMPSFTVPGLPEYTDILWTDLAWAIPVAVVAAVVATGAQVGGRVVETAGRRWPLTLTVPLGGLVVGVLAALWVAVSGQSYDTLLFSGEDAIPAVVAESSAGALLLLVLLKGVAYAVSLGCGFRGGPVFPALFLGVGVGVLASLVLPDFGITPAVAAALSAAAAAAVRLPFAAAALSLLLVGTAGAATTTLTILGSVVGFLVAMAVTRVAAARVAAASSPGDDQATA
jgi:H+/Cl- antiporter ClcA